MQQDSSQTTVFNLLLPKNQEPYLEWPYFGILIGLLLISVALVVFKLPKNWSNRLLRVRNGRMDDLNENYASLKEYAMTSPLDNLLHSMPGIFLIIGLSGTFLSLSFALDAIGKLPTSGDNLQDDLKHILALLGSKFKISIWGIICNVVYRIPYSWSLKRLNEEIRFTLRYLKERSLDSTATMNKKTDSFRESLLLVTSKSNGYLESIDTNFKSLDVIVAKLVSIVGDFGTTVTGVAKTLKETTEKFVTSTDTFNDTVSRFEKSNKAALEQFTISIESFDKNISNAFKEFAISVSHTLDGISNTIKTATNESSEVIGKSLLELKPVVTKLDEQMKAMNGLISNLEGVQGLLYKEIYSANEINGRLAKNLEDNQQAMLDMTNQLSTLITNLEDNVESEMKEDLLVKIDSILNHIAEVNEFLKGYQQ